jgi:hypothetical protein
MAETCRSNAQFKIKKTVLQTNSLLVDHFWKGNVDVPIQKFKRSGLFYFKTPSQYHNLFSDKWDCD